jgi:hypothetical protein
MITKFHSLYAGHTDLVTIDRRTNRVVMLLSVKATNVYDTESTDVA